MLRVQNTHTGALKLSEDLHSFKQMISHLGVWFDATNKVCALQTIHTTTLSITSKNKQQQ